MATLNGYKTSGTFAATTTFQTCYTFYSAGTGIRGYITITGGTTNGAYAGMVMAFFDWSSGSWPSLTQMAVSGNAAQGNLNPPNTLGGGSQTVFIQQNGTTGQIQVKVLVACTVNWFVTYI